MAVFLKPLLKPRDAAVEFGRAQIKEVLLPRVSSAELLLAKPAKHYVVTDLYTRLWHARRLAVR